MTLTIDRESGSVSSEFFCVSKLSTMSDLRKIAPREFCKTSENSCRFAMLILDEFVISLNAFFNLKELEFIMITPSSAGENWENWNKDREERKLNYLWKLMKSNRIRSPENFPWGHVKASIDGKSQIASLVVAYYQPSQKFD